MSSGLRSILISSEHPKNPDLQQTLKNPDLQLNPKDADLQRTPKHPDLHRTWLISREYLSRDNDSEEALFIFCWYVVYTLGKVELKEKQELHVQAEGEMGTEANAKGEKYEGWYGMPSRVFW